MSYVFIVSALLVMVGELADKSQLLALVLATRYKAWQVLLGISAAALALSTMATLVGQTVGSFIPAGILPWVTGLLFVGFGLWTLRGDGDEDTSGDESAGRFGPVATTAVAFFLAEFGDKTQLVTMTIAADPGGALLRVANRIGVTLPDWVSAAGAGMAGLSAFERALAVTLGATAGMVLADGLAIVVGRLLGRRLPHTVLKRVSGTLFVVFGVVTIGTALVG